MKKIILLLSIPLAFSGCSLNDIKTNILGAQKKAEEKIENVKQEVKKAKENILDAKEKADKKIKDVKQAVKEIDEAIEAVKKITGDGSQGSGETAAEQTNAGKGSSGDNL